MVPVSSGRMTLQFCSDPEFGSTGIKMAQHETDDLTTIAVISVE
jgi:hypothetical protein